MVTAAFLVVVFNNRENLVCDQKVGPLPCTEAMRFCQVLLERVP